MLGDDGPFWTLPRFLSGLVVASYIVLGGIYGGIAVVFRVIVYCILPVACIWFSSEMGRYRGFSLTFPVRVNQQSPGCLVALAGWILLLLLGLLPLMALLKAGRPR